MIRRAAERNSDMILLPELWSTGYDLENARDYAADWARACSLIVRLRAPTLDRGLRLDIGAAGRSVTIALPTFRRRRLPPAVYRKIQSLPPFDEENGWAKARRQPCCNRRGGRPA